jgi:WhiB family transcriptional regulator, redox-sensing transcriptional regulator
MSDFTMEVAQQSACSNEQFDPDWWFPTEVAGKSNWSRTPDANKARAICSTCPILEQCRDYSIQFNGIYGIWGGWDMHEMRAERKRRNILAKSWAMTYVSIYRGTEPTTYDEE